jgi:hypothetical protein
LVTDNASEGDKVDEVEGPPFSLIEGNAMKLPEPTTFAEGQRYIYGLLAAAAGIFCGAAAAANDPPHFFDKYGPDEAHNIGNS